MTIIDDIKLSDIDPEDFGDTLLKLEKSFGVKFADNSMKDAKTFGDICDSIESQINLTDKDDCTTQQAFYKVRKAISLTQNFDGKNIELQTKLEYIFPRSNRRQKVKAFQHSLGIKVNFLTIKNWLGWTLVLCFLFSLIAFFFNWLIAVSGLTFSTLVTWTAYKFSKELSILTVAELTEKISREHYSQARRHSGTVNKCEIVKTVQDVFIADHLLDREHLTRDATLGWT